MEMVAMDMKLRGMYIARQLSFKGVSFKIEEIPIDKEYIKIYNEAVALVSECSESEFKKLRNELPHDKTNKMICAPSEDSDQPGCQLSLISLRWTGAQADPSLRWVHRSFCWFCHEAAQIAVVLNVTRLFCFDIYFKHVIT